MAEAVKIPAGTILSGNGGAWMVGAPLGSGSFGHVYSCRRAPGSALPGALDDSHVEYAMKVATIAAPKGKGAKSKKSSQSAESGLIYSEYITYNQHLGQHPNLPVIPRQSYGEDGTHRWLVMQKLHTTLRGLVDRSGGTLPWPTVAGIVVQLLSVLSHVHSRGFVYQDLNLDNIMVGPRPDAASLAGSMTVILPPTSSASSSASSAATDIAVPLADDRLYLVDFGLATRYRNYDSSLKPAAANGTPLFASVAHAKGGSLLPVNDLECLAYLTLCLLKGREGLPWHSATSEEEVVAIKLATSPVQLCKDVTPPAAKAAMTAYLGSIASLTPTSAVPYGTLQMLFAAHAAPDGSILAAPAPATTAATRIGVTKAKKAKKAPEGGGVAPVRPAPARGGAGHASAGDVAASASRAQTSHAAVLAGSDSPAASTGAGGRRKRDRSAAPSGDDAPSTRPAQRRRTAASRSPSGERSHVRGQLGALMGAVKGALTSR